MTSATSELPIDVSKEAIKRCLIDAYKRCQQAEDEGARCVSSYWNGYIRALQHVLEMENE
jgi:hypothetical protein